MCVNLRRIFTPNALGRTTRAEQVSQEVDSKPARPEN